MAVDASGIAGVSTVPATDYMHTHPNCRCAMVPVLRSWTELGFPSVDALLASGELDTEPPSVPGEELLSQLPAASQRRILGKGRWNLWRHAKNRPGVPDGWGLSLQQMLRDHHTPDWGAQFRLRTIDDLLGELARMGGADQVNARRVEQAVFPWRFREGARYDFYANPTPVNKEGQEWARGYLADVPEADRNNMEALLATITAPDRAEVRLRVPGDILPLILDDGRVKSQFEVGSSTGIFSPELRRREEERLFGYPASLDDADRPIYGYLGPVDGTPETVTVDQYGEVVLRLKADVRARTTFTTNDSLNAIMVPTPIEQPDATVAVEFLDAPEVFWPESVSDRPDRRLGYFEAQVHGGLVLSDISEVVFTIDPWAAPKFRRRPSEDVLRRLDELGIPHRVVEIDREQGEYAADLDSGAVITPRADERALREETEEYWTAELGARIMDVPYVDRGRIKARREAVVANHLAARQWGDLHGITQPEYLRRLDEAVAAALNPGRVEVRLRVPASVIDDVLSEGRIKSQFETGTSQALFNPELRAKVEATAFGYPSDTPDDQRPVSTYVTPVASEPDPAIVASYGGVVVRLKNSVRGRTTVLSNDSLAPGEVPDLTAEHTPIPIEQADHSVVSVLNYPAHRENVPAEEGEEGAYQIETWNDDTEQLETVWRKPQRTPFTEDEYRGYLANLVKSEKDNPGAQDHLTALTRDGIAHERYAYWEAQVHGTLPTTDIAEVVFTGPVTEAERSDRERAKDLLEQAGIPYRDTVKGERGYIEGLDDSNWMTHPSHRRVGAVAPAVFTRTEEAEIEPEALREEAALYVKPAPPMVLTPEAFEPVQEPKFFPEGTPMTRMAGEVAVETALDPGTFTNPFSLLGFNPGEVSREVIAALGDSDPVMGGTPRWKWSSLVNPAFQRIEQRHLPRLMALYDQTQTLKTAAATAYDPDRQMAINYLESLLRDATLAIYGTEHFDDVIATVALRYPHLVTKIRTRGAALDVLSGLNAFSTSTMRQGIEIDSGVIVHDQIRTIARMLDIDISDLVFTGAYEGVALDAGAALARLKSRWAERLADRTTEEVEATTLDLHFPAPTLDAATQRRPREDLREPLRDAMRDRLRNMTWMGRPGMTPDQREAAFDSKADALRRIMAPTRLDFRTRVPIHLIDDVVEDGALRSQFDPANDQPPKDPHDFRAAIEEAYYGIPADAHFTERPIYGYLSSPEAEPGFGALDYYGTAILRLKPERVAHRTTFVVGDSVMDASARSADAYTDSLRGVTFETAVGDRWHINPGTIPSAVTDPQIESVGEHFNERQFENTLYDLSTDGYVEAQYHAGVTLDDIAEVVFIDDGSVLGSGDLARAQQALDRVGIPHRTVDKHNQRYIVPAEEQAARKAADPTWLTRDDLPAIFGLPMSERRARWAQVPVDLRDRLANAPTEIDNRVKALVGPDDFIGMPDSDIARKYVDTHVAMAPEATRETLKSLLYGVIDNMVEHAVAQYRPVAMREFRSGWHMRMIDGVPLASRLASIEEQNAINREVWIEPSEEQRAPWLERLNDPEQGWATYVPDRPGVLDDPNRNTVIHTVYVMTKEGPASRTEQVSIVLDPKLGVVRANVAATYPGATTEDMSRSAARAVFALADSGVIDPIAMRLTPSEHSKLLKTMTDFGLKAGQTEAMATEAAWLNMTPIVSELTRLAVAQEIETTRRVLGDHGARHLEGNARMASDILRVVPGHDSPADFAMMHIAAVIHDAGYLTTVARNFLDADHPRHSRQWLEESGFGNRLAKVFGEQWVERLAHVIDTHADTEMDWVNDPQGSAFRVADNLALFQKEKLPALLHLVPENTPILVMLGRKEITAEAAQIAMTANVQRAYDEGRIDAKTRDNLVAAIDEVSDLLPKFTLGMLGGEVDGFQWTDDHLTVNLTMRPANEEIAALLDLNQRQFEKFAEAYGQDASGFVQKGMFEFTRDGKPVLTATIKRDPIPALREDTVYYGTPEPAIEAFLPAAPPTGPPAAGVRQADEGEVRAKALLDANGVIYDGPGSTVSAWTLRAVMDQYTLPGRAKPNSIVTSPEGALGKYNERGILTSILWKSDRGMVNVRRVAYGREADQFETDTPYQVAVELVAAANLKMKAPMPPGIHFAPAEDSPERRLWAEAIEVRAQLADLLGVKPEDSAWSGEFSILGEGARGWFDSTQGLMGVRADWTSLSIRRRIEFLTHELLHSFSPRHERGAYREAPGWEEGPTESLANFLAPVITENLGYARPEYEREGYNEYVDPLHRIAALLGHTDPDQETAFLKRLFAVPLNQRQALIVDEAEGVLPEGSARWGALFQHIRALNIDNPLDWGGKTSRDRLTDRALDVESLFAISEELRLRFKERAPELATWKGWYGHLVRMTTPEQIGEHLKTLLDELDEAQLFGEDDRELKNRLRRALAGALAGIFLRDDARGVFFEELTPTRDEVLDPEAVSEAITRFQQLVAERPDDAVIPIVVRQTDETASIVFRVMSPGGVPVYVRVEYAKDTESITSARLGWQIEPTAVDRQAVLDWLRGAAAIDARLAVRPDVLVLSSRGEAVEMGLTPEEQNARDPGMMDALVPEAEGWLVEEDEDGQPSPEEANARAARRGLTPTNRFAWRTPTIADGAIFYSDGSVKALVSLVWPTASETPRIDVTPAFGNVVSYGDLTNERRSLVAWLEANPGARAVPGEVRTITELEPVHRWTETGTAPAGLLSAAALNVHGPGPYVGHEIRVEQTSDGALHAMLADGEGRAFLLVTAERDGVGGYNRPYYAWTEGTDIGDVTTGLNRVRDAIHGFLMQNPPDARPQRLPPFTPEDILTNTAEGYMGPQPSLTLTGLGTRDDLDDGVHRQDQPPDVRVPAIVYNYVEGGQVLGMYIWRTGIGGYVNESEWPQMMLSRDLPRERQIEVATALRQAMFADGHVHQPGQPPFIRTPPQTEAVELFVATHIGGITSDAAAEGVAEQGTPDVFEEGTTGNLYLRGDDGRLVGRLAINTDNSGQPTDALVVVAPDGADGRDGVNALSKRLQREAERRGWSWRWTDTAEGRAARAAESLRLVVENPRFADVPLPDYVLPAEVGFPKRPYPIVFDRSEWLTTTPEGARARVYRTSVVNGVATWGATFSHDTNPDDRRAAIEAVDLAWQHAELVRGSHPLPSVFTTHGDRPAAMTAELAASLPEGFSSTKGPEGTLYSLRDERGAIEFTVTNAGPMVSRFDANRKWSVFSENGDPWSLYIDFVQGIANDRNQNYPSWTVVANEMDQSHQRQGYIGQFLGQRQWHRRVVEDVIGTVSGMDIVSLHNLHLYRETPSWIGAQVTAEELASATVFAEDSDYRYLSVRRRGVWTGVMTRVADGSVVAIAQTSLSEATGNARSESLDVYAPEFGHLEPSENARVVDRLTRFSARARPPIMGPLERQMTGVTLEPRDSTLTHALLNIRAQEHEAAIAALNATARGVEQEFRDRVYLATVSGQTHTFVFTREDRTVIGVFQTAHPTGYEPSGTLFAAQDATDDELIAALSDMRRAGRESPIIDRLVNNPVALPQPDAPAEDFGSPPMRSFPLEGPKNGSLFSDVEGRPQWMLYDEEGRAHTIVLGTQDGVGLNVHRREPYGPLPDFEARWTAAYEQDPVRVNAEEVENDRWLSPLRDGSPDQGTIDPDWLDAFVDPPPDNAPAGMHVYGAINGTGVVYQTNYEQDVEAALVVPLRDGHPIPGQLGVVFAWDGDQWRRDEGAFGYVDTEGLRLKAVEAGYIDPETARWRNGMTDPMRVVNPVLYAEVTDDESLLWHDRTLRQRRQEWANWYGSIPSDVPDSFIDLDLDTDFNGTMVQSVASQVGNEVLSGPPDTFRFVSWNDGGYASHDNEGAVIYYGPTGAAVSVVWFGLDSHGEVSAVHWTKTHVSYRRQGISTRVYEYAVTLGLNIEKESGLHGLTGIGTQYRNARIAAPRSRVILNVSRMRPEFGEIATLDDVKAMRANEAIRENERRLPAELEAHSVELIPDSAPETYEAGPGNVRPLNKTTPVIGRYEDGAEPSLRVEMDPSRVTAADVDFAAAYAVRRNDQDAVVVTIVGAAMKRLAGNNPNGFLLRVEGISTDQMQALYDAVAEVTPNASIDDARGVVEFSVITSEGDISLDMKAAWQDLAQRFGARFSVIPAHIRWVWYDEATKAAAEQSWFTFPGAVSLTADDVKKSLTEAKDGRAAKVRDARDRSAPAPDDTGTEGRTGRPVRRSPRTREGVAPAADGTRRRRRPPREPGESPDARPARRRYRAPADGRLTAPEPRTPDEARARREAETILRSVAARFGLKNRAWSGAVRTSATDQGPAYLDWDGTLVVTPDFWQFTDEGQVMILAHEMMHAVSGHSEEGFAAHPMHEEGVAEALARIWRAENGVPSLDAYSDAVNGLERLREVAGMEPEAFYLALINTPLAERQQRILDWLSALPSHPDRVMPPPGQPPITDWRDAALYMTAWMYPHFTDPFAVVELLRRVEAEGNVGPARMRQFRESLLATSPFEWADRIDRFAAGVGVSTGIWMTLSTDPTFPYSRESVRRFDPLAMDAMDIGIRLGWEALEYILTRGHGEYRAGDVEVAIPVLTPRQQKRLVVRAKRKRAGPGLLAAQRQGGGGGEEEPITTRRYGPMRVSPVAL